MNRRSRRRVYMNEEELRETEIRLSNDYLGEIVETRWKSYLECYEVVIEFDSIKEVEQFRANYGYTKTRGGLLMR